MHHDELEPIAPDDALELYLDHRRRKVTEATLRSNRFQLGHFVRWCADE